MGADQRGANWAGGGRDPRWPAGAAGADRARAGADRFTGTKRAAGPKLTAEVIGRSDSACVVTPGMSAWADGATARPGVANPLATRWPPGCARRFFAGVGWGLRVAARRGLAGGCAVDVPAGLLLPGALG